MGLTSAMNTGATGLNVHQTMLETIGDNIANINTTAFKSNRADLENQFAITLQEAQPPAAGTGGTNPSQVGLGAGVGAIQRSFTQGAISPTGSQSDLAVDGQGFFVVNDAGDNSFYTRDGAFHLNAENYLVTRDGLNLQGYLADASGTVDATGALSDLVIPLGTMTQAQASTQAVLAGNLNAAAQVASQGSVSTSSALVTANGVANANTALVDLVDGNGTALIQAGDIIELGGVEKGGFELPSEQFVVGTDGGTVQDLLTFLQDALAINMDATLEDGAGVAMNEAGQIVITSNSGEANAVEIQSSDLARLATEGRAGISLFAFSTTTAAVGEGPLTSFKIYDSLGTEVDVRLRFALESKNELGTTWRFYAESLDDPDRSNVLGTGTVSFNENGQLTGSEGVTLNIDRTGSGAASPLAVTLDFASMTGLTSSSGSSTAQLESVDGKPFGTLFDFKIDEEGRILGAFTNGASDQVLGQVAVATFMNPQGLELIEGNKYTATANSGQANVVAPKSGNAGRLQSGYLELSNVDLAREFIGLINASTGFSASSRVITTADELLQELLLIAR